MYNFYDFVIFDIGIALSNSQYSQKKVLFKSKKKLEPKTSLFNAIEDVFKFFLLSKKDIINSFNEIHDINMFNHHIHSIQCNGFEFLDYYGDRNTTLAELTSVETNISNGESIHIFVKNMNTKLTFQPVFSKISKVQSDETESLSSISNISLMKTTKIPVFIKIISNIISFKTEFHQFATSSEDKYSDLLQNVLNDHMAVGILSKEEHSLLKNFE